jgi:hypothetical protein
LVEFALRVKFDIFSDGFGGALYGFGGHRQTRQQLQRFICWWPCSKAAS